MGRARFGLKNISCLLLNAKITHSSINFVFPVAVKAYERCWFFGDEFTTCSFEQYYKSRQSSEFNGYVKSHFDVTGFYNGMMSENPCIISRLANLMGHAILTKTVDNKLLPLSKLVVVVPDADIIRSLNDCASGLTKNFARLLNFIMTEHERSLASFRENLPAKSLKQGYPHVLWIQALMHDHFNDNLLRYKFNKSLEEAVMFHSNIKSLYLKKVWNSTNTNLYVKECQRFTSDGYYTYWEAVDKMVRYCDSIVLKKSEKLQLKKLHQRSTVSGESQKGQQGQKD